MAKKALLTGITGQDGSYLTELLLDKGYEVHGTLRRSSIGSAGVERIEHLLTPEFEDRLFLHTGELADQTAFTRLIDSIGPDEVYNLAAQSHVKVSFDAPEYTADVSGTGVLRILEAIRQSGQDIKFYQASTSEMFGKVQEIPQTEKTPFYPRSPYGVAKLYGHWITVNYRESYDMYACSGILFNHESPRRGEDFVTRKITTSLARILAGKQGKLKLGNLDAKRDWGYAKDYVEAMYLMLQQETPDDYVIATNETHSIKEFLEIAFGLVGKNWQDYVVIDEAFMRPAEVDLLIGDPQKAKDQLGWEPKHSFEDLVRIMIETDLKKEGVEVELKENIAV